MGKHVAILISDGVSLRNFVYNNFIEEGKSKGWKITFINQSPIDFKQFNLDYLDLKEKPRSKSNLLKRARKKIELANFESKFKDEIYRSYKFPAKINSFKSLVKQAFVKTYTLLYSGKRSIFA